jgi:hypothetical protein
MTTEYIREITRAYPSIREVWLIGSRANDGWNDSSDWDYIVHSDDIRDMNSLCQDIQFKRPGVIDLLFVCADGDTIVSPWPDADGYQKQLAFGDAARGGLGWQKLTKTTATYQEDVDRKSEKLSANMVTRLKTMNAVRVYVRI